MQAYVNPDTRKGTVKRTGKNEIGKQETHAVRCNRLQKECAISVIYMV